MTTRSDIEFEIGERVIRTSAHSSLRNNPEFQKYRLDDLPGVVGGYTYYDGLTYYVVALDNGEQKDVTKHYLVREGQ
jgi:hypothetical protein